MFPLFFSVLTSLDNFFHSRELYHVIQPSLRGVKGVPDGADWYYGGGRGYGQWKMDHIINLHIKLMTRNRLIKNVSKLSPKLSSY